MSVGGGLSAKEEAEPRTESIQYLGNVLKLALLD